MRLRHYSPRTERCYCDWIGRFIRFHGRRHPREMAAAEVTAFLTHRARESHVRFHPEPSPVRAFSFFRLRGLKGVWGVNGLSPWILAFFCWP